LCWHKAGMLKASPCPRLIAMRTSQALRAHRVITTSRTVTTSTCGRISASHVHHRHTTRMLFFCESWSYPNERAR
jgi:hypothetical protein